MKHLDTATRLITLLLLCGIAAGTAAQAQLISEPPLPTRQKDDKHKPKPRSANLEWMWQYTQTDQQPNGREHELIQDSNYHEFLADIFTAPQSFWGSTTLDPRESKRKSLAETVDDFLTIPGKVIQDDNRYVTVTGHVFHYPPGRGLLFADLNTPQPLVAFAAIDWIRESHPTTDPEAEYTLWIFTNKKPGTPQNPDSFPPPLLRSLTRWLAEPLPGSGIHQKVTAAVLVDADGTPHQIPVPGAGAAPAEEAKPLPKRNSN